MLNSATIDPPAAITLGNAAAGYTIDDVPTTRHTLDFDRTSSRGKYKRMLNIMDINEISRFQSIN